MATIQNKREDKEAEEAAYQAQLDNAPKTCPKCGATTKGQFCEYCGSKLD